VCVRVTCVVAFSFGLMHQHFFMDGDPQYE
jgi:hypothetical protein